LALNLIIVAERNGRTRPMHPIGKGTDIEDQRGLRGFGVKNEVAKAERPRPQRKAVQLNCVENCVS
jgi:hypothetical protein